MKKMLRDYESEVLSAKMYRSCYQNPTFAEVRFCPFMNSTRLPLILPSMLSLKK